MERLVGRDAASPLTGRVVHVFGAAHPTAAGHFPGNPIIPGACLLREVVAAVGGAGGLAMDAVKFLHPVRPGDAMAIEWRDDGAGGVRFTCLIDGGPKVMTGVLRLRAF